MAYWLRADCAWRLLPHDFPRYQTVSDRDDAAIRLARSAAKFPRLRHLWADQSYRGREFLTRAHDETDTTIQVMRRQDGGSRAAG